MALPCRIPAATISGNKENNISQDRYHVLDCPTLCEGKGEATSKKRKNKPAGGFNLRKSIAWNPAFFTEQDNFLVDGNVGCTVDLAQGRRGARVAYAANGSTRIGIGFCVQRYQQITTFKPERFWSLKTYVIKDGNEIQLEWDRKKLFDFDVTVMFQKMVTGDGILKVTDISVKEECKARPPGLNTINLLKVASSALGIGPQIAMHLAERLYTQGFISYPRTESTAYPSSFDFRSALAALVHNPLWTNDVRALLDAGFVKPKQGHDAGDHPPITPMRLATEETLDTDAWRLYQYICQHFIGIASPDCRYMRTSIEFASGGEAFHCVGYRVTSKGFTSIMPWLAVSENNIPAFKKGDTVSIHKDIYEGSTSPPDYLSESELISHGEEWHR